VSLRVGSGNLKGRKLSIPKGRRFSSGRTKKGIFDFLAPYLEDARVLDLFAGAGGLGIEALSRGARFCLFVDSDRAAAAALKENLSSLFSAEAYDFWPMDFRRALERLAQSQEKFDVVLADPPYMQELVDELSKVLSGCPVLAGDGILAIEHSKRALFLVPKGLKFWQSRAYGDTVVSYFRCG
jgi:16S rRNA (guanine(966)-N(2))-methyltransferase RsmD